MIVLRMVYLRDAAFCGYSSSGYRFASPAWADRFVRQCFDNTIYFGFTETVHKYPRLLLLLPLLAYRFLYATK